MIKLQSLLNEKIVIMSHVMRKSAFCIWTGSAAPPLLNVVAQKNFGRPRKSWDEVIKNDRKELDMDSADPQNCSEWRGRLRGRLVKKPNPR